MADTITQQSILNKSRKDKFLLVLNLPDALKKLNTFSTIDRANSNIVLDTLQYSVYGAVVPTTNIEETSLPYAGQTLNLTSGKREKYEDITVNFTVDNGYNNWWVLWKWLNFINDAKTSTFDIENLAPLPTNSQDKVIYTSTTNLQPYQTLITVYGLDEYNNKKIQWSYSKAFITKLNGITYNYRDAEQMESSFTFAFSQLNAELL
jgi:hypothetical protein